MRESNCTLSPKILQEFEIFSTLSLEEIEQFCRIITPLQFNKGELIIVEGEIGDSILILLDGEVEITQALTLKTDQVQTDLREKSLIHLSSQKRPFFGEMGLFSDDYKRSANVKAVSVCEIGKVAKHDFFRICDSYPQIGNKVMQNVAKVLTRRLKQTNQNVLKLTTAFSLILES